MSVNPVFIGSYRSQSARFGPGEPLSMFDIWNPGPNGSRIHRISATANVEGSRPQVYELTPVTSSESMGTGSLVDGASISGNDQVTRTSGSFVADGWKSGDILVVRGATSSSNDAKAMVVYSVDDETIGANVSGRYTGEALPANSVLYRATFIGRFAPAHSHPHGSNEMLRFGNVAEFFQPDQFLVVGPEQILAAIAGNDYPGGNTVQIRVEGGDY